MTKRENLSEELGVVGEAVENALEDAKQAQTEIEEIAGKVTDQVRRITDGFEEDARENKRFPKIMKGYGILLLLSGIADLALLGIVIAGLIFIIHAGGAQEIETSLLSDNTVVTLVINGVLIALSALNASAGVVMGIRLLKNRRNGVARQARIMVVLQVASMLCTIMLYGISGELAFSCISILILVCLEAYADPALRRERIASRKAKQLEEKVEQEQGTLGRDKSGKGYIELNFFNMFWIFVVCSFLGLLIEIAWHMIVIDPGVYQDRAGLLFGPFSPIYGLGGLLITIVLNRLYDKNPLVVFLAAAFIGAAFEYVVSWWMEFSFGITAWDYHGTFLNIDGRTNFKFFCMWGILGIVWLRLVLPRLLLLINKIPWNWRYSLTVACATLMILDGGLTITALDCWFNRQAGIVGIDGISAIERFCNDHYDDAFMSHRFQTMTIDVDSSTRVK